MVRRPRPHPSVGSIVALAVVLSLLFLPSDRFAPGAALADHPHSGSATIKHVVFLMLENHAFDNYFGAYCPTSGPYCPAPVQGYSTGLCVPLDPTKVNGSCVRPFPFTAKNWSLSEQLPHTNLTSHQSWDRGAMDGFYLAEHSGLTPFGYYNGTTAPLFWDLAQEYGLGDAFFSSTLSYSLPNHWFSLAGQAPAASFQKGNLSSNGYLGQANNTSIVEDLLNHHRSVSWKYYDYALPSWKNATANGGAAYNLWNPLAAKYESYSQSASSHFVSNTAFFGDAKNGSLPSISWVIPFAKESDHPPANVTRAEAFVASVVDAVESSSDWNSTVLFLTWDDYGGFYDGVAPPFVGGIPLSFRVPFLTISPYTAPGLVVHSTLYFESVLHYVETLFGLGCITSRDCNAPLPTAFLNVTNPPRAPIHFPTKLSQWTYPFVATPGAAPFEVPSTFTRNATGDGVDVD